MAGYCPIVLAIAVVLTYNSILSRPCRETRQRMGPGTRESRTRMGRLFNLSSSRRPGHKPPRASHRFHRPRTEQNRRSHRRSRRATGHTRYRVQSRRCQQHALHQRNGRLHDSIHRRPQDDGVQVPREHLPHRQHVRLRRQQGPYLTNLQLVQSSRHPDGAQPGHGMDTGTRGRVWGYSGQLHQSGTHPHAHGSEDD